MRLPNFLLIGAAKSGTTSIHNYLSQHPDIFMSSNKEPRFFAAELFNDPAAGPGDANGRASACLTPDSYQSLFLDVADEKAVGESSAVYIYSRTAPLKIAQFDPAMKIIAILRNPVDRAYSQFSKRVTLGIEPLSNFIEAIEAESWRIEKGWHPIWHYVQRGFYCKQLKRYYAQFDAKQIRVFLYEDLQNDPKRLMKEIYGFLGVDDTIETNVDRKHNANSTTPRAAFINRFMHQPSRLTKAIQRIIPKSHLALMTQVVRRYNTREKPPISKAIRNSLMRMFQADVEELQDLINRDLSMWLADADESLL